MPNTEKPDTTAGREANARLRKSAPDQALAVGVRALVHMPPIVSNIRRQILHLGESTNRLTRWVTGQGALALAASKAVRLPLLTKTFDYFRRKAAVITPMWQRTPDLPWLSRRPKRKSRFGRKTLDVADVGRQPDDLQTDILLQDLNDAGESQSDTEAAETYPSLNAAPLSPPSVKRGLVNTADDIILPLHTGRMKERHFLKEPTGMSRKTAKERTVRGADMIYPALNKRLFSSTGPMVRTSDAATELPGGNLVYASSPAPDTGQIMGGQQIKSGNEVKMSHIEQSAKLLAPDALPSSRSRNVSSRQIETAEERPGKVARQSYFTYLGQRLSRVFKPLTRSTSAWHRQAEIRLRITGDRRGLSVKNVHLSETGETRAGISSLPAQSITASSIVSVPQIGASARPAIDAPLAVQKLVRPEQKMISEPKGLHYPLPARSGSPISEEASKRPVPPAVAKKAYKPDGVVINAAPPEGLTGAGGSGERLGRIHRRPAPQPGRARREKQGESHSVEPAGRNADVGRQTNDAADIKQGPDTLYPAATTYGSISEGVLKRNINTRLPVLSYFTGSLVRPLAANVRKQYMTNVLSQRFFKSEAQAPPFGKSEEYGLTYLYRRMIFSSAEKYARQPALRLPVAASMRPSTGSGNASGKDSLTDTYKNIYTAVPGLAAAGYPGIPELAFAPVSNMVVKTSSQIARVETESAEGGEQEGEPVQTPDIDVIARDVYGILKRRLMAERERALGVY